MVLSELFSVVLGARRLLQKQQTLKVEEVPALYKEPGVLTGYRLPGQSFAFYLLSVFQVNNETINVWTHFIGFFVVLYKVLACVNNYGDDPRIYSLVAFGICCLLYTSLSAIAHTIHSASPYVHYMCFQADYAGIGLYSFGTVLPAFYISADYETKSYYSSCFLPVSFFVSWLVLVCNCVGKLRYRRPYPFKVKIWQIGPCVMHYVMIISLLYPRFARCYFQGIDCSNPALKVYATGLLIAIVCALTFSSHLPEKRWPGYFDVIGQGHQVFHVVSVLMTLCSFEAGYRDLLHSSDEVLRAGEVTPSLFTLMGYVCALCVLSVITILFTRPMVLKRVNEDGSQCFKTRKGEKLE